MKSLDGEVVPLKRPVTITPEVEVSGTAVVLGDGYTYECRRLLCFVPNKFVEVWVGLQMTSK